MKVQLNFRGTSISRLTDLRVPRLPAGKRSAPSGSARQRAHAPRPRTGSAETWPRRARPAGRGAGRRRGWAGAAACGRDVFAARAVPASRAPRGRPGRPAGSRGGPTKPGRASRTTTRAPAGSSPSSGPVRLPRTTSTAWPCFRNPPARVSIVRSTPPPLRSSSSIAMRMDFGAWLPSQWAVLASGRSGAGFRRRASRHGDRGELEDQISATPDGPGADLDQLVSQRGQRLPLNLLRQGPVLGQPA